MRIDRSYSSLIQGVSQQHVVSRLPGQHTEVINLISDPVTGPRRRSGAEFMYDFTLPDDTPSAHLRSFSVELEGAEYSLYVNTFTGYANLYSRDGVFKGQVAHAYLAASAAASIDLTAVREDLWICNTEAVIGFGALSTAPALLDPSSRGFYWIRAAAFSKRYEFQINTPTGYTYFYDTPDGTSAGDAALATPEHIATALAASVNAATGTTGVTATVVGAIVYMAHASGSLQVITSTGELYVRESKGMRVPTESDLPPYMPSVAGGVVCAVGNSDRTRSYFYWNATNNAWIECGAYGSSTKYTNTPRRLYLSGGMLAMDAPEFPARLSGDDLTNPYLPFSSAPYITGMGSYQGRLVLLSGGVVNMSASGSAMQFSRSTVTALLTADPISVTNSGLSAARLRHCLQYNRDLLLLSATHQAVVPGGTTSISPQNALVVLTGSSITDITTPPVQVGQWTVFSTPSGTGYSGFSAVTPSQYTASQYRVDPITEHLPRYFPGSLHALVSSGAGGFAFAQHTGKPDTVQVFKYLAQPDGGLVQNAWQEWSFPYPVATVHTSRDDLIVGLNPGNGSLIVCTLNYRLYADVTDVQYSPLYDMWHSVDWEAGDTFTLPTYMTDAISASRPLLAAPLTGSLRGEPVGVEHVSGSTYKLHASAQDGPYAIGIGFPTSFIPTPPLFRNKAGDIVALLETQLMEMRCTTRNSGEYNVIVSARGEEVDSVDVSPVLWSSAELVIGERQLSALEKVAVPVEQQSATSTVQFLAEGTREFNPVLIEYTLKLPAPMGR